MQLTKTFAVETSYISICFYCYVIAQQLPTPTYAVAMSLYQFFFFLIYIPEMAMQYYKHQI